MPFESALADPVPAESFLVAVINGNAPNRHAKTRILKGAGVRVVEADSGRTGLALVRETLPDLVLLDVHLPNGEGVNGEGANGDGIAVCRRLKEDPHTASLLILQTSALPVDTAERVRALEAGADGFLAEPAEPQELLAIVHALLRLRHTERQLEAAKGEADRANAAKSHFLAAASHDLRQPLQAQRLFLTLLDGKLTTPDQRLLASRISESLAASESLLRTLMDLSALDSGRIIPDIAEVDLRDLVSRLLADHAAEAQAKGLRLRAHLRPLWIRTDPILFERMLRNLVTNAIRYTSRGGILLAVRQRGGQVVLEVWDSGPGVPEEEIPRIFRDYYRIGNGERNRGRGLGLGLAIVQRTAELLGHSIGLRSRVGRGSVFFLRLGPAVGPAARPGAARRAGGSPLYTGRRVLLVEDDEMQRLGLSLFLGQMGFEVVEAGDAETALAVAGPPLDLIISDMRLPGGVSGMQVVAEIRRQLQRCLPAIFQTGDTDPALLQRLRAEPAAHVLHKPYNPARLQELVSQILPSPADCAGR